MRWSPRREARRDNISPNLKDEPIEFVVAAVIDPGVPDVFTVVAYRAEDVNLLLAEQFPGRETRMLSHDVLSEHVQAEVRALLELATRSELRDGVVLGTTDGQGGWADWNLRFFAPKPGRVPDLPAGRDQDG